MHGPAARGRLDAMRGQIAPVAAITVFGLSIALSHPLLGLLLERMGASGLAIGFNTMAAAIANVLFAPLFPRVMARVGMGRLLVGSGVALAALMLVFPLVPGFWAWTALRLLFGVFAAAIFFASEYWIVAAAPEGRRGRVIAVYTISLSASFVIGPLLLKLTGVEGLAPFALGAAVLLAGLLPVIWGLSSIPPSEPGAPPSPLATLRFFATDPVVLWGVVVFGAIEFGAVALLPVWAVRSGLTEGESVMVMASFAAGAILFAPLLGWMADRFDRRRLLLAAGAGSAAAPLAMIALAPALWPVIGCGVLWGAAAVGLYTLALTELGARYAGARLAEGNAAVVFAYGLGALVSPVALGQAMDAVPPDGLLWLAAAAALGYALLALVRIRTRPRPPGPPPLDSADETGR
jgi:MFS family permease